jgi:hypothetical protein
LRREHACCTVPKEVLMRILALAILAIGTISIGSAAAQTYDPAYPVCLQCTPWGPTVTNAATRRCLSATRRHPAARHSASSIHILRARKSPRVIGIVAPTRPREKNLRAGVCVLGDVVLVTKLDRLGRSRGGFGTKACVIADGLVRAGDCVRARAGTGSRIAAGPASSGGLAGSAAVGVGRQGLCSPCLSRAHLGHGRASRDPSQVE